MSYLLDTHTLLWLMFKDEALSDKARSIIEDEESLFVSIASFWEIAIKQNLEKLEFTLNSSRSGWSHEMVSISAPRRPC